MMINDPILLTVITTTVLATFYYAGRYLAKRSLAESLIENVLESLEKDGLIATRTDKDGEKEIIPISDVIAKAVKDAKTK
jgi:hypothetical protein|tara:strand:+ start:241 stop:480 length:240 start_codon:yes stop_codon:yes gene_type:complete